MSALRVLILCNMRLDSAQTTIDYIAAFKRYSRHECYFANPTGVGKPSWLDLDAFDVVAIHYSTYTLHLDRSWVEAFQRTSALKVQFIQDEYRLVHRFHERMRELRLDLLFTVCPDDVAARVYPREALPDLAVITTLTGFVPEELERRSYPPLARRRFDVTYRGRDIPMWWLGELYHEKVRIGDDFLRHTTGSGLRCSISCREEDRIYGDAWFDFLRDSRCVLGTESGASVVDFTGEIEARTRAFLEANPGASFEETRRACFADDDGRVVIKVISPRVFEAIGCGTALVLFEGHYSGILRPHEHYVPLKKDFSNIGEVVATIRDHAALERMTARAFDDIIGSGRYSYRSFVAMVDDALAEHRARRAAGRPRGRTALTSRAVVALGALGVLPLIPALAVVNEWRPVLEAALEVRERLRRRLDVHPFHVLEKARLLAATALRRDR